MTMNLKSMFKDASLNNFEWLLNEDTYEPKDKDNNKKDDLEVQWGLEEISPKYSEKQEAIITDPECKNNTSEIVQRVREYMNQGQMEGGIIPKLYDGFSKYDLKVAMPLIKKELAKQGIVGCVAVDVTGYKDIKDAIRHASKSPFKKLIKFVIGYSGVPIALPSGSKEIMSKDVRNANKNAVDSFLSDESDDGGGNTLYCKELMLPILAGYQDIDDHWKNDTFIDLVTLGHLTEKEAETIKASTLKPYQQIKCAFKIIHKKSTMNPQYKEKVSSKEHAVKATDMQVEVAPKIAAKPELQVDPVNHETDSPVEINAKPKASLKVSEKSKMSTLEVSKIVIDPDVKQIAPSKPEKVELEKVVVVNPVVDKQTPMKVSIDKKNVKAQVEVNNMTKSSMPVEVASNSSIDPVVDKQANVKVTVDKKVTKAAVEVDTVDPEKDFPVKVEKQRKGELILPPMLTQEVPVEAPICQPALNVVPKQVQVEPEVMENPQVDVSIPEEDLYPELEVAQTPQVPMNDVDNVNPSLIEEIELKPIALFEELEVLPDSADNEIELEQKMMEIDIDPSTFLEDEFQGSDNIEIAKVKKAKLLNVSNKASFDFE